MKHTPALIVLLCCLAFVIVSAGRFAAQVTGDVNGDGSVNALDVQLTINGALGMDIGGRDADINDDGSVNALDVQLCINAALGITNGNGGNGELPPDPVEVASEIDPTIPTAFAGATEFIYTGDDPIQTDVAPETIEAKRVAVLRGKVTTRDGEPLPGVEVTILGHPEFGRTLTREDGMFDIAVNGGGLLTVNYAEEEHLSAQRQIDVPWRDYAWLPDVVMIPVDPVVTEIDLTASDPIQVAQGSVVTDDDGTRQATLLFPQGTSAELVMPDGSTQPLTTFNIRATEYTVGDTGPDAMPAILPPTSRYTYCVEVTADEAIDAGATDVAFDQPVYFHVENFIGFPVGSAVPVGYYDRQTAQWIASKNGLVIKIVSINGGLAELDTDGDDVADDVAALDALNITEAERQELAALYDAGQTLWRAPITHFTPWDCNWPGGPPGGAGGAGGSGGGGDRRRRRLGEDDPCADENRCVIEFQGQVLGEGVPLAGVPYALNYRSDRCPGRRAAYEMEIVLCGDTMPEPLKRIELEVLVAGRRFQETFPAETNQTHLFTWDGYDAYGRLLQGEQPLTFRIGYVYDAVYYPAGGFEESFARFTDEGIEFEGSQAREEVTLWQEWEDSVGVWDSRAQGMGGWTLDVHHSYSPASRTLYMGDGRRRSGEGLASVVTTVACGGTLHLDEDLIGGVPATEALLYPYHVTAAPDGSYYFATLTRIFHVDTDGMLALVAGQKWPDGFEGDGAPAIEAVFNGIHGIDLAPDGSLYVADIRNHRVRRIGPDGIINTVAGNGTAGNSGDGGPATEAELYSPTGVAAAPDGGFYIAQGIYPRVRHVSPDGIITTVAGGDIPWGTIIEGGLATENYVDPTGVKIGPDGSIYILTDNRIRRVTPDGIINTVVGTGTPGFSGDGGPATEATFQTDIGGVDLDIGPDGSIYLPDSRNDRVRLVGPDGIINTIAGNGDTAYSDIRENERATGTELNSPRGAALGPDGTVYVACDRRIRTIAPAAPGVSAGDLLVPSPDGGEVFVFNPNGKHLSTVDSITGAVQYEFAYDGAGYLVSITDGDANVTTLERDDDGDLTAIVGPYGQRNEIVLDDESYLASMTATAGASWTMAHSENGLLASFTDPNGATQSFTYGDDGRLTRDDDPAGGFITLTRTEFDDGFEVSSVTAEGRTGTFGVEILPDGIVRRVTTSCDGTENSMEVGTDGVREVVSADGTASTLQLGPDPRFGMMVPLVQSYTETTPGGLILSYSQNRTATFDEDVNVLKPLSVDTTHTLNGQVFMTRYSAGDLTVTRTTPEGRQAVTVLDERGRPIEYRFGTLAPVYPAYDGYGRLWQITQGSGDRARTFTISYDGHGFAESVTDPIGRTHNYILDQVGRITSVTDPGGAITQMSYDSRGNLVSLAPPGRPVHSFLYNAVNRLIAHDPPDVTGSTDPLSMLYNLDHQMTSITRADGRTVAFGYASCGRLETATIARGDIQYEYDPVSGNLDHVVDPDGELTFGYDGSLMTSMIWTGTVAGQVAQTYDEHFRVASRSVNGADAAGFVYDNDGLLVQAGDLAITPDAHTGLITSSTLGDVADTRVYDEFGDVASYSYSFGAEEQLSIWYTRDKLGRITQKDETQGTTTDTYTYTYDLNGRLSDVAKNGTGVAAYTYDPNGNSLTYTGSVSATYDDQDRLLSYGTIAYTYRGDGSLSSRTDGSETTLYEYDELGSLVSVTLPDGTEIEYLIDGRNRRIGKRVDGSLVQGFLYKDMLNPVAELDGSGTVVSRFVYGTRPHVPDYMTRDGSTYRIISDNVGSPRFVVDAATGTVIQSMSYDAFGRVLDDTNPGFQPFGFAGGLYDPDTGLIRFGARDYDPEVGRWTAPDPMLFGGGSMNLYAYANNDPVNRTDPSGLDDSDCDKPQDDCNGRTRERHESEGRRLSWRRSRFETSIPSWLDSVVGLGGAVSGAVVFMEGVAAQALAGASSALGLAAYPIAFEGARQTADDLAETLVDERVERDMEQLDEIQREINRTTRERDCP